MSYTLRIETRSRPKKLGDPANPAQVTYTVPVEDGQLQFPPNALRIIFGKHPDYTKASSFEWVGERPDVFACGALSEEEAKILSQQAEDQADLAMKILEEQVEPEKTPSLQDYLETLKPNGPVKVIGQVVDGEECFEAQGSQSSPS
jgi:hypothetical protein